MFGDGEEGEDRLCPCGRKCMNPERYHRQQLLPQIGAEGQARLARARVLLVGCGALGSGIADQLARAGVGYLRIVDRDIVELTNLQRQVLFDELDVEQSLPKAVAAGRRLAVVNSSVTIDARVTDLHAGNAESLMGIGSEHPMDLVIDGTDNVETRYLINDAAVKHGVAWLYGGCVGTEGRVMPMLPGGACLRCVFETPPSGAQLPACDTAGVLGAAAAVISSLESALAIRLLAGGAPSMLADAALVTVNLWPVRFHSVSLVDAKRAECLCCGAKRFSFLDNVSHATSTSLCGRNAVQLRGTSRLSLDAMELKLKIAGEVESTPYFLRCALREPAGMSITVFPDGRLIVHGTADAGRARAVAARYVGA